MRPPLRATAPAPHRVLTVSGWLSSWLGSSAFALSPPTRRPSMTAWTWRSRTPVPSFSQPALRRHGLRRFAPPRKNVLRRDKFRT
eukprot:12450987-Prorocentrum_lima.AAC.1